MKLDWLELSRRNQKLSVFCHSGLWFRLQHITMTNAAAITAKERPMPVSILLPRCELVFGENRPSKLFAWLLIFMTSRPLRMASVLLESVVLGPTCTRRVELMMLDESTVKSW
ncbi:hypothetical protein BDA96_01G086400 [Sorghum bicolor]|uniref:Uncharacterized protein n=1 Tax=Sorghum bicolor TaxID=4558 RepID=A0A921UWI9_SORBI|nr:hypothetical protein BDA96_01G086400 [Sorghum bicolor]